MKETKTYAEWHAEQMKNPEFADECYRLECSKQIELSMIYRGWSAKQLARRLGISTATVKAVIAGDVQLSVYGLFNWLRVMGYDAKIVVKDLETER